MRIAMVAGEMSGDILGSGLIESLKKRYPDAEFVGIGGDDMQAQGLKSLYPMERLSVMGLWEVLGRLRELLAMRKQLVQQLLELKPDVFIGIDAPDFNLGLETKLKQAGIKTVHYVSPSVWAWRKKRIFKIAKAVDLMLCLLPFETDIYKQHKIKHCFVGHPLADQLKVIDDQQPARSKLGLVVDQPVVAIMPGSRGSELKYLARPFIETAQLLAKQKPGIQFAVPLANQKCRRLFEAALQQAGSVEGLTLFDGQSRDIMAASDVVLMASGTATLEGLLIGRPMVPCYKFSAISHQIFIRIIDLTHFSLPNLLGQKILKKAELLPEMLQSKVEAQPLAEVVNHWLDAKSSDALKQNFADIAKALRCDASEKSAQAVIQLLEEQPC
ncbi:lipid-A-disaccharide synthase [Pelagibaculum spongiae]|uniref:Lipid-A-disaccharide synthase n=1 Tax=Pelagibaculum spongiae TaxID=2080658 RepID=A0A2V1GPS8_9GAMM|nr:lipid-A-disaccharide synthase [Pelagibaculum spongiae]PVZ64901.1 lipid-A-disaccharide synthase [Pelagibaculum spongiae]